jgi:ABC-type branched-subunit amino acid transport system substrate-binding protein
MQPSKRRSLVVLGLFATVALLAAGCGKSSQSNNASNPGNASATTGATAKQPTRDPIVIGTTTAKTGGLALAEFDNGFQSWADQLNRSGGLQGHPVKVTQCDDKTSAEGATACNRRLIDDQSVAVVGGFSSLGGSVSAPAYKAAGLAYIPFFPVDPAEFNISALVAVPGTVTAYAALADYLSREKGLKKFAVMRNDIAATQVLPTFVKLGAEKNGAKLVADIPTPLNAADYLPAIQTAISKGADAVLFGESQEAYPRIFDAYKTAGAKFVIGSPGVAVTPSVIKAMGSASVSMYLNLDFPDPYGNSDSSLAKYRDAVKANKLSIDQATLNGYANGVLFQAIFEAVGPDRVSRKTVADYLPTADLRNVPLFPARLSRDGAPKIPGLGQLVNYTTFVGQMDPSGATKVLSERLDVGPILAKLGG